MGQQHRTTSSARWKMLRRKHANVRMESGFYLGRFFFLGKVLWGEDFTLEGGHVMVWDT